MSPIVQESVVYSMSNEVGIISVGHDPDALDIPWQEVFQPHLVSLPTPPRPKCMACKAGHSNYTAMSHLLASGFGFGRQEATNSAIICLSGVFNGVKS